MKAQRESTGIAHSFFNFGTRWGWVVNATPRSLYPRKTAPVLIVQEAGWAPGPVWTGAENLAPTGIQSPDRPARSELVYRLSCRGPQRSNIKVTFSLSTPLRYTGAEVQLHSFLTSTQDGKWSASRPGRFITEEITLVPME
jgi:hypothetical protein